MIPSPSPEDRLDDLLLERRRELDAQVARLLETVTGLERREELVRDSRASVERILRVGANDLDLRESELADLIGDVTAREERLRAGEAELAQRRSELGAVELKREAVERRERALDDREAQIAEREAKLAQHASTRSDVASLVFVPGVLYRLAEIEPTALIPGEGFELESDRYVVARIGPSPLPADTRRCAYLVRGVRGSSSDGSS
jgi:vacuolar-type H+-ATPase subunit I/STV1